MQEGAIEHWLVVSRGDSTLRGHCPLEATVIAEELGPFAATLLVPAFLEGARTTVDGVHRLGGSPVHESPFARDRLFGYRNSFLPAWLEEKSGGRIPASWGGADCPGGSRIRQAGPEGSTGWPGRALLGRRGRAATAPSHRSGIGDP